MKISRFLLTALALTAVSLSPANAGTAPSGKVLTEPKEPNSTDLFSLEGDYTGSSDFKIRQLGSQDAFHEDFNYSHRFLLNGQWYLRTGVEYERFDFGSSRDGIPNHLQAVSGVVALEYVEQNFAAVAIELHPGFYFENDIRGRSFDMPIDIYTTFKINDKLFVMIGGATSLSYDPVAFPIGGIIWLINKQWRLEAIFPKPALIWNASDDWEFRVQGEVVGGSYRMDDNNPQAKLSNAIVQYSQYRAGVQATYGHFKPFDLVVGAGYSFERQFDFFRANTDVKVDGAFYVKAGLEAKF